MPHAPSPDTTTRCETCGKVVARSTSLLLPLCPACLLQAGRTPSGNRGKRPVAGTTVAGTTWAEVFPQWRLEDRLHESDQEATFAVSVPDGEREEQAILQVLTGTALERAGGAAALEDRARRFATAGMDGVASILEFGDLCGAFYFLTVRPEHPTLREALAAHGPTNFPERLSIIMTSTAGVMERAHAEGLSLSVTPGTTFIDLETGEVTLTPSLIPPGSGSRTNASLNPAVTLEPGTRLGAFELLERCGEGGFGEVWKGHQHRPVQRDAAIKVLKSGLFSPRARARFELEQQALARLDHPHIARFFDGGATRDGRPYFAMEWIEGSSLAEFCTAARPSLDKRLQLFRQIATAIHHAHLKGFIHRDLKPSNVMVVKSGDMVTAKVIDFGIARVLDESDHTLLTRGEEIVGTPASMSPEQAAGAGEGELDARSDVYGLGVLLYELLAGRLPFDPKLPFDELRRHIREIDPPKPSSLVKDSEEHRHIRGELDWITLRCLEKDPARRYPSVSSLLQDLDRRANEEPVEAGPPELAYRMRKFAKRRKGPLAAATMVVAALVTATLVSLAQLKVARAESHAAREAERIADQQRNEAVTAKDNAKQISDFLIDLLRSPTPWEQGEDVKVIDLLDKALVDLRANETMPPERKVVLLRTLSDSFQKLGRYLGAAEVEEDAFALDEQAHRSDGARRDATWRLINSYTHAGRFEERASLARSFMERGLKEGGPRSHDALLGRFWLATGDLMSGRYQRAYAELSELHSQIGETESSGDRAGLARAIRWQLGMACFRTKRHWMARQHLDAVLASYDSSEERWSGSHFGCVRDYVGVLAEGVDPKRAADIARHMLENAGIWKLDVMQTSFVEGDLATALQASGEIEQARVLERKLLADTGGRASSGHYLSLSLHQRLALRESGDAAEGIARSKALLAKALAAAGNHYAPKSREVVDIRKNLMSHALKHGDDPTFVAACRDFLDAFVHAPTENPSSPASSPEDRHLLGRMNFAAVQSMPEIAASASVPLALIPTLDDSFTAIHHRLIDLREYDLATPFAETLAAKAREMLGEASDDYIGRCKDLANTYEAAGRMDDARVIKMHIRKLVTRLLPEGHLVSLFSEIDAADEFIRQGNPAEGILMLESLIPRLDEHIPRGGPTYFALSMLAGVHANIGRFEDFALCSERRLEWLRQHRPDDPRSQTIQADAANGFLRAGRYRRALDHFEELLDRLENTTVELPLPFKGDVTARIGYALMHLGDYERGASRLEEGIELVKPHLGAREFNNPFNYHGSLARCYRELGKPRRAIEVSKDILNDCREVLDGNDGWLLFRKYQLVEALQQAGAQSEAAVLLESMLVRLPDRIPLPDRASVLARLALAYRALDRPADATRVQAARHDYELELLAGLYRNALEDTADHPEVLIAPDSRWRWFRAENGSDPSPDDPGFFTTFMMPDFDDSGWENDRDSVLGGFGYEDFEGQWTGEVDIRRAQDKSAPQLAFFRHRFTSTRPFNRLELQLQADDGVVIFLDGKEVGRDNLPSDPLDASLQPSKCRGLSAGSLSRIKLTAALDAGEHVLALSLHDYNCWNEDLRLAGVRLLAWNEPDADKPPIEAHDEPTQSFQRPSMEEHAREALDRRDPVVIRQSALILAARKDPAAFLEFCKLLPPYLQQDPTPNDLRMIGYLLLYPTARRNPGLVEEGCRALRQGLAFQGSERSKTISYALIAYREGNFDEAWKLLSPPLEVVHELDRCMIFFLRGMAAARLGKPAEAKRDIARGRQLLYDPKYDARAGDNLDDAYLFLREAEELLEKN
ncbi:serine/threonine-protein kinase [Luteolibacter marinus]|uniref:serine/threonine-protein kinase n=1 Tax=Luteolibacter marinus TaxID=2776705 RepID=UPI0018674321|nr:serine/threonine-protein kinase [Luteolibacter marinus]